MLPSPAISVWSSSAALSGALPSAQQIGEQRAVERVAGRLDAEIGEHRMTVELPFLGKQHEAEAPRIVEDDARRLPFGRAQMKDDMVVRGVLRALVVEDAGRRDVLCSLSIRNEPDMPRWQIRTGPPSRCSSQIFGAAAKRGDVPAGKPLAKLVGKGKAQIRPPRLDASDRAPSITGCRPRRTVSTSGSSGIGGDGRVEGRAVRAWRQAEMLGDRLADIGEGCAQPDVAATQARPGADDRHALARMVGAAPGRVAAVVGGQQQQVAVPAGGPAPPAGGGRRPRAPPHSRQHRGDGRTSCRNRRNWRRPGRRRPHRPCRSAPRRTAPCCRRPCAPPRCRDGRRCRRSCRCRSPGCRARPAGRAASARAAARHSRGGWPCARRWRRFRRRTAAR